MYVCGENTASRHFMLSIGPQSRDSSGSGVTLMKQIGKLTDAMFAVGGSELTQQILPIIGFKECGTIVIQYAWPVRPLLRLGVQELTAGAGRLQMCEKYVNSITTSQWRSNTVERRADYQRIEP